MPDPSWISWINQGLAVAALVFLAFWAKPRLDRLLDAHINLINLLGERLVKIDDSIESIESKLDDRLRRHSDAIRNHDARLAALPKPTA